MASVRNQFWFLCAALLCAAATVAVARADFDTPEPDERLSSAAPDSSDELAFTEDPAESSEQIDDSDAVILPATEPPQERAVVRAADPLLAVDYVSPSGHSIKLPHFDANVVDLDPRLRNELVKEFRETLGYISKILQDDLTSPKSSPIYWLGVTKKLVKMTQRHSSQREKIPADYLPSVQFRKFMRKISEELIDRSKKEEKKLKGTPKDRLQLRQKINDYLLTIEEAYAISPTVAYANYTQATIDGRPFVEVMAELMGELRYNGFKRLLGLFETLFNAWSMFTRH